MTQVLTSNDTEQDIVWSVVEPHNGDERQFNFTTEQEAREQLLTSLSRTEDAFYGITVVRRKGVLNSIEEGLFIKETGETVEFPED